jgi:ribosomal protein L29
MAYKTLPKIELEGLNDQELSTELKKAQRELLKSKMELSLEQLKDTSIIRKLKKYIAQIKTLQNKFAHQALIKEVAQSLEETQSTVE